jgi:hypothetical protein
MNWFNKIFRKAKTVLLVGIGVAGIGSIVQAQPYYSPTPSINSSRSTVTNLIFGPTTNGIWPNAIVGGGIVTNLIRVDVSAFKEVTVECIGSPQVGVGAVTGQEVVWTLWKNIPGTAPTNAIGTGLPLELAGLVTNRFAASAAAGVPVASSITLQGGNAGAPQTGQLGQLGGITTLYIGKCDATTLTNGTYYTNYSVWVQGK